MQQGILTIINQWLQACVKVVDKVSIICCNLRESDIKLFSNLLCVDSINMDRAVIKILHGCAGMQTVIGELAANLTVRLSKNMKIG